MAISKDNLNVYISISKNCGKSVVNAWLVPETRRKELFSRLQQIYTSACKGIKLASLEIDKISEQNEKMAKDLLSALFGANASDYRGMDLCVTSSAKTMAIVQMLLSVLTPLFKNQNVILYADPNQIRINQLQNALKKAGLSASIQKEDFLLSPGLQISRFLGDLYISDRLPSAKIALERELAYEKRFIITSGDQAFLTSIVPKAQQDAYAKLKELPASVLESWAKKGVTNQTLATARTLLESGMPAEDVAGFSASKLTKPAQELLENWKSRKQAEQEKEQQEKLDREKREKEKEKTEAGQKENKTGSLQENDAANQHFQSDEKKTGEKKPEKTTVLPSSGKLETNHAKQPAAEKTSVIDSKTAGPSAAQKPAQAPKNVLSYGKPDQTTRKAWDLYAQSLLENMIPSVLIQKPQAAQPKEEEFSKDELEAAQNKVLASWPALADGLSLRKYMLEKLSADSKTPVLDLWVQEQDNTLVILAAYTRKKLLNGWKNTPDNPELEHLYKIYRFEGDSFHLRMQTFFAWMSTLQNRYFLHIPPYMETEFKKAMLEQNWMIPMSLDTIRLPEASGTLMPAAGNASKVKYLEETVLEAMDEEAIRTLSLPDMSLALTKLLARAMAKGLKPMDAQTIWYNTQGIMQQERMRSLAGQYVFTTSGRKEMEALLNQHVDLALWDFLSHPALSAGRRNLIRQAWDEGWSMEQIRSVISVRNSTKAITQALQNGPAPAKNNPDPASFVQMPVEVRHELESILQGTAKKGKKAKQDKKARADYKNKFQNQNDSNQPEQKSFEQITTWIDWLEENPLA